MTIAVRRKMIEIDESKCDGCGQCVPACAEGAIAIRDGKARLVSEVYCDGVGACVGHCPQAALRVIEREAAPFDEAAVREHLRQWESPIAAASAAGICPGTRLAVFPAQPSAGIRPGPQGEAFLSGQEAPGEDGEPSGLGHWPVQLRLVPPGAPFLRGAEVLLVADCVPFALADFHRRFLRGRPVLVACPKLDDTRGYVEKLAAMIGQAGLRSLTVVHMEVPCCTGLVRLAEAARELAGQPLPLGEATISIRGQVRGARSAV